jgi:hypothetical protein
MRARLIAACRLALYQKAPTLRMEVEPPKQFNLLRRFSHRESGQLTAGAGEAYVVWAGRIADRADSKTRALGSDDARRELNKIGSQVRTRGCS